MSNRISSTSTPVTRAPAPGGPREQAASANSAAGSRPGSLLPGRRSPAGSSGVRSPRARLPVEVLQAHVLPELEFQQLARFGAANQVFHELAGPVLKESAPVVKELSRFASAETVTAEQMRESLHAVLRLRDHAQRLVLPRVARTCAELVEKGMYDAVFPNFGLVLDLTKEIMTKSRPVSVPEVIQPLLETVQRLGVEAFGGRPPRPQQEQKSVNGMRTRLRDLLRDTGAADDREAVAAVIREWLAEDKGRHPANLQYNLSIIPGFIGHAAEPSDVEAGMRLFAQTALRDQAVAICNLTGYRDHDLFHWGNQAATRVEQAMGRRGLELSEGLRSDLAGLRAVPQNPDLSVAAGAGALTSR